MGGQAFLPFLIGKIDRRGNQLLVGLCRLFASGLACQRGDDGLQILQYVLLGRERLLLLLMAFIIEAITARLEFSGFHASVGAFCHHGRSCIEKLSAYSAEMVAFLLPGCPPQERRRHPVSASPAVFSDSDTVAVQTHGHPSVGITGMDKAAWQVKVILYYFRKGTVCLFVGMVCSPVGKSQ